MSCYDEEKIGSFQLVRNTKLRSNEGSCYSTKQCKIKPVDCSHPNRIDVLFMENNRNIFSSLHNCNKCILLASREDELNNVFQIFSCPLYIFIFIGEEGLRGFAIETLNYNNALTRAVLVNTSIWFCSVHKSGWVQIIHVNFQANVIRANNCCDCCLLTLVYAFMGSTLWFEFEVGKNRDWKIHIGGH